MPERMRGAARLVRRCVLLLCAALLAPATFAQVAPVPAATDAAATPAPATIRVGVATMQPGTVFFERFGHDAIVIDDPALGEPRSYNFGFFDPSEPGFIGNFVRGRMRYMLVALPLSEDLQTYRDEGRGVSIQWLNLGQAQARRLQAALEDNARPEHARYRYDYFTANCATRVRDALDDALGGALKQRLQASSLGETYRSESVRLASPAPWMWIGFDIGLGPYADQQLTRWDDAFVPMRLADSLREAKAADGRPLVRAEQVLLPHRIAPEPAEATRRWWPWLLAGLVLAAGAFALARCAPRAALAFALPFWTACGLLGATMLFIWLGTAHVAGWANHNLLLFSPLCLLAWPGALRIARRREPGPLFRWTLRLVAIGAVVALFQYWLPVSPQRNAAWICLLLPVHLALLAAWPRRAALAAPR